MESDSSATDKVDAYSPSEELSWSQIESMGALEKRNFYMCLTDSLPDLWGKMNVDATTYAVNETIPILPTSDMIHLHYRSKVRGYTVDVDFIQSYSDLNFGRAVLHFAKRGHSFNIYCDAFSDEQLISDDIPYVKKRKAINLSELKPGADIYLNYMPPKYGEYLSDSSPFYFKDMDFDGVDELIVNNLKMDARGYNTYDVFKVFNVDSPLRLKGLPFTDGDYKITNYNVEYEPRAKCVLDKRYDGFDAYGHYRYKSVSIENGRVFILQDAEDMGFYHPKDRQASDSVNLIQPYKKYERVNGKMMLVERGVYEHGNYGWNHKEVVLENRKDQLQISKNN